jgi:DNA modification methylase
MTQPRHVRPPKESQPVYPRPIQVTYRRLQDLQEDPGNPRLHTAAQIHQIALSIQTFGFNVPVLLDGAGRILAGHGRVLACRELGWTEVPTIRLDHLTEAQTRAFQIADNRLTEQSTWDDRLLGEQLKALAELDLDFNLESTGFTMGEIDLRIQGLGGLAPGTTAPDPADEVPPVLDEPVSRLGDLWQLGPHRLACGNALETGDIQSLMHGRKAALVFTDPPYNVPIAGNVGGLGRIQHRDFLMACGEMSPEAFTAFLGKAFQVLTAHIRDGSLVYVFMDWRHQAELLSAARQMAWEQRNLCVWVKDNAGMGSFYRSQHELVLIFKHGKGNPRNNIQLGKFGRNRSNVWHYPGSNSFARSGEEGNLLALHPTVKPVALVVDALLDASSRGDLVLDPFLGSGSTLIAAERVGRVCRGLELDPAYVDTAIRRWQNWTGESAIRAADGTTFNTLECVQKESGADHVG